MLKPWKHSRACGLYRAMQKYTFKMYMQNEIQSVYLGNGTCSIFKVCSYAKSRYDINGLKKDSMFVFSESKETNRIGALTCLKKVIEEGQKINFAQYDKIMVWIESCPA